MIGLWSIMAVSALGVNVRRACIGGQCSEGQLRPLRRIVLGAAAATNGLNC